MTNKEYYKACDANASVRSSWQTAEIDYLKSIAHSLASIADNYEKILGDPADNKEDIE